MKSLSLILTSQSACLHTGLDRGIVTFDEERPYHLTYILSDYQNNHAVYHFTVRGQHDPRVTPRRRLMTLDPYRLFGQCLWPLYSRK